MTIVFKIDDLLLDLFPHTKESNIDHNVLKDELSDFYMAVTMYMVETLQYFADMPKDKIKNIAVEIAELGMHGISPDKKGYQVRSIPDAEFSGYHLLAYYYVSWAIALPEMMHKLQLPFEKEYEVAKGFVEEGL